jgi:tetratricopeptide (TPR) repeat protein/tRNA A-37 threonylcarbamoyl transferase component Bud32
LSLSHSTFDPDLSQRLSADSQLGPYCIEALLGAGGMGEVYRARDTRLDRMVALKVLPPEHLARPELRHRFLQEARAVSALNHPNIVILYDIGSDRGIDFLVLEYVPGKTLKKMIPPEGLPFDEVVRYGVQIAQGLRAAHAVGILHRDIKPANIMVTPESQVKILDFGVAKLRHSVRAVAEGEMQTAGESPHTKSGMVVGTFSYMSPEQTRAEPLDGRSDIFSLGCVLYEVATGRLPFRGPSTLSLLHEIATVNPLPPSALRPDLPPEFDLVVERALAKEKDRRYASASELAQALEAVRGRAPASAPCTAKREPETFVGREPELRRLREVLRNALEGSGKIVFLTGEPGIGKSALAGAFLAHARRDNPELLVARGACIEQYGAGEAYLPFLDALSELLSGPRRERVIAVLRRYAPTWCLQFPAAFGSTSAYEQLQRETIGATKERMLREFGEVLGALSSAGPLVLLLEDLHWSDPSSIDLLRHVGPRASELRLLLIGTLRPEEVERKDHPLRNCKRELQVHNLCEEIRLRVLELEHIVHYLNARFAPNDFPPELPGLIYRKTEGHPLFSSALIELLVEHGYISKSNAPWALARPLTDQSLQVPESVRGMIRRKIEDLDDEDRRVLQYASAEGEEFTSTILAGISGVDELTLEQRLHRLDRVHRLIDTGVEEGLPDGSLATRYRFVHALYQNIVYEDLLSKHRALLHRQVGEQLVRRYGGQTARVAGALAIHFERGRDYPRAIEYRTQAAEVATQRYDSAAAEEHYSRALQLVEKLPPEESTPAEIALLHRRGAVRLALGHLAEAEKDFTGALERARAIGDAMHECVALNAMANPFLSVYSQRADEMPRAEKALQIAEQTGNPALRAEAMVNLAIRHSLLGEPAVAKTLFEAAIPLARSCEDPQALLTTLTYRGVGHFFQTEFGEAEEVLSEASQLASQLRNGAMLRTALFFLGWTRASLGRVSQALATLNELLEMSQRNGDIHFLARVPKRIAWIHEELQDFQYPIPQGQAGTETVRGTGRAELVPPSGFRVARLQAEAAEKALSQGDLDRAGQEASALLINSTRHGPPKYVATAHKILADIAIARGDLGTAEGALTAALVPLRTHPAPLVAWKIYGTLGRVYSLKGDPRAAREVFTQAAEIVQGIASSVTDERLRSTFLNAPAVQEVLLGSQ